MDTLVHSTVNEYLYISVGIQCHLGTAVSACLEPSSSEYSTCARHYSKLWAHQQRIVKVKVKVTQLYWTLCDPMDYTVHVSLQARILGWVAFPFSRGFSHPRDQTQVFCIADGLFTSWDIREALSRGYTLPKLCPPKVCLSAQSLSPLRLFVTSWTAARQAPLSLEFSRQEYWSGLPFPSPGATVFYPLGTKGNRN